MSRGGSHRYEPVYALGIRAMDAWVRGRYDLRVHGLWHVPGAGPFILAPNHVSHEDPVVMGAIAHRAGRRVRAVAIAEVFDLPVLGRILHAARQIPLDRERSRAGLVAARRALREGEGLLLYPEGTIVASGKVAEARSGVGRLALDAGVPVVPVTSWGLRGDRCRLFRAPAGVVVGPPVDLSRWAGLRGRRAAREAASAILGAIHGQLPRARELALRGADMVSREGPVTGLR
jgi:1-acyl-sn-glycerol-3-phosphate acyltransferase